jgi:hypothetical protein
MQLQAHDCCQKPKTSVKQEYNSLKFVTDHDRRWKSDVVHTDRLKFSNPAAAIFKSHNCMYSSNDMATQIEQHGGWVQVMFEAKHENLFYSKV